MFSKVSVACIDYMYVQSACSHFEEEVTQSLYIHLIADTWNGYLLFWTGANQKQLKLNTINIPRIIPTILATFRQHTSNFQTNLILFQNNGETGINIKYISSVLFIVDSICCEIGNWKYFLKINHWVHHFLEATHVYTLYKCDSEYTYRQLYVLDHCSTISKHVTGDIYMWYALGL